MDDFLSHADAALLNRNKVLHYVKNRGQASRTDIWKNMNISRASVTQIIRQLEDAGLIIETGEKQASGRRMSRFICVNEESRYTYIFDWGTRLLCLVNMNGGILEQIRLTFPQSCMPSSFAGIVLDGICTLKEKHPVDENLVLGVGIVMPGLIDSKNCRIIYSSELGWHNVDIRLLFAEGFGDHVFLERSGNMQALGEAVFGSGKDIDHIMLILLENEGIGMSTVVHGDCQHGCNFMYGELGHIKLGSSVVCSCGQRGCLEAVVRDCMFRNGGVVDEAVLETVAYGVSTAVSISDPGIVILSGRLVHGLTANQRGRLQELIHSKITSADSRALRIQFRGQETFMSIRGMSAFMFSRCFAV